jgi:hypothetical protein
MTAYVRQSTSVTVQMGPALDKTDGVSEKTGLSPTVEVSKNGGTFGARSETATINHDANGWYTVALNGTDTASLGRLVVKFDDATTHLPVWHEFMVVPASVHDALVGGTDTLQADVQQWLGTAVTLSAGNRPDVDVASIASAERDSIADALLKRDFSAVSGAASRSMLNALRALRNRWAIAGGTLTVYEENDTTSAWTGAVTTTSGDPVSEVDPS